VHVGDPSNDNIGKGDDPKVCQSCHDRENSPNFEFDTYAPKILGLGHGQKLPKKSH
jgi:hypothetical protein